MPKNTVKLLNRKPTLRLLLKDTLCIIVPQGTTKFRAVKIEGFSPKC